MLLENTIVEFSCPMVYVFSIISFVEMLFLTMLFFGLNDIPPNLLNDIFFPYTNFL